MTNIYKKILAKQPVIIAEAGVNHNGKIALGKKLIKSRKIQNLIITRGAKGAILINSLNKVFHLIFCAFFISRLLIRPLLDFTEDVNYFRLSKVLFLCVLI
jgi:hypothetical protein